MYQWLLEAPFVWRLLAVVVPVLGITLPLAARTWRGDTTLRDNDNVMTAAARFVGAAFIFLGSFANVTAWQGAGAAASTLKAELNSLSGLAEQIHEYESAKVMDDALSAIVTYVDMVEATELAPGSRAGTRLKKATAATGTAPQSADDAANDIRTAVVAIQVSDQISDQDAGRMLSLVDQFQRSRSERRSTSWPAVSGVVMMSLLVVTLATLLVIGLYPSGPSRRLKLLQVLTSSAVVSAAWFAIISSQNVTTANPAIKAPLEAFRARYGG
jgi:hypothetical protein